VGRLVDVGFGVLVLVGVGGIGVMVGEGVFVGGSGDTSLRPSVNEGPMLRAAMTQAIISKTPKPKMTHPIFLSFTSASRLSALPPCPATEMVANAFQPRKIKRQPLLKSIRDVRRMVMTMNLQPLSSARAANRRGPRHVLVKTKLW